MTACPSCGHENADDARFCSACGTALAESEVAREQRKVVTVLFCDLVVVRHRGLVIAVGGRC